MSAEIPKLSPTQQVEADTAIELISTFGIEQAEVVREALRTQAPAHVIQAAKDLFREYQPPA